MRTRVGYAGGTTDAPAYRQLGDHTECFQVDFDPRVLSYAELLELFWQAHRPGRPAYERQYRAAVFCADEAQREAAEASRARVAAALGKRVLTDVEPLARFFRAEAYHQKYYLRQHAALVRELAHYPPRAFEDSTVAARLNGYVAGKGSLAQLEAEAPQLGLSDAARAVLEARVRLGSRFVGCS